MAHQLQLVLVWEIGEKTNKYSIWQEEKIKDSR